MKKYILSILITIFIIPVSMCQEQMSCMAYPNYPEGIAKKNAKHSNHWIIKHYHLKKYKH